MAAIYVEFIKSVEKRVITSLLLLTRLTSFHGLSKRDRPFAVEWGIGSSAPDNGLDINFWEPSSHFVDDRARVRIYHVTCKQVLELVRVR